MVKHYKRSIPMLVQRQLNPEAETKQYMCIIAFTNGVATQDHFDTLLFEMNLLLVAGQTDKKRRYVINFVQKEIQPALRNIKERIVVSNKFGVNSSELKAIKKLIEFSRDFWQKQTGQLYAFCFDQVTMFYDEMRKRREA